MKSTFFARAFEYEKLSEPERDRLFSGGFLPVKASRSSIVATVVEQS